MQTLPQPESFESEARPVSEILAKSNPAEMPAMRASLSFLTSAGAELASVLARRNREYDDLLQIVTKLPPEWIEAAKTGGPLPDVGSLRAELELAKDERLGLHGQLAERDQLIRALQEQLGQAEAAAEAPAVVEERAVTGADVDLLNAQVGALQSELDAVALARVQAEENLRASEAELDDVDQRLAGLRADLLAALPEDFQADLAAAPIDEQVQEPRQRRAMRLGALAAAISALVERSQQSDALVEDANARVAAIQGELETAGAARVALEADLGEREQSLEDYQAQAESLESEVEALSAQVEQLKDQGAALQAELDAALAAKAAIEEQLRAREGELAELNQQVDSVSQQVLAVLPEDVAAQIGVAEEQAPAEAPGEEDQEAARVAEPKTLGLGALAAGVAAAVDLSRQKSGEASEAGDLLALAVDEKAQLEVALHDKEQAVADLNSQIEGLTTQLGDLQAQLDTALALKVGLEQQLGERDENLVDLHGQIDDAASRLQAALPEEDLLSLQASLEGAEAAPEGEEVAPEGEHLAPESGDGGARALGLAALVSGVTGLLSRKDSDAADLAERIKALQVDLDGLGQEKVALEAVLAERSQELDGYNDYVLNLQGQVNQLAAEKSALEADLLLKTQAETETEAQIEALRMQIGDLTAQVETLTAQVGDLQAQLEASVAARAELEQALQTTQAQLEAAQADLAQIEEESQGALGETAARLGAVGAGAAAVAALKGKEDELAAANEQVTALQGQVDQLAADSAELADLRTQMAALQQQVAAVTEERAALEEQLGSVQQDLEAVSAQRAGTLGLEAASELSETLARLPAIKTTAASAAIVAGVQPSFSPRVQALTDVKGIGSVYQQRLYNAGVGTYWELASLPDADMQETLQIPDLQRTRIDFEETRADAFDWAHKTNTVGLLWDGDHVDDFEPLPGIGKVFEKRLYEAGITTYEQLAACDIQRLAEIVRAPAMREVNYDEWLERAKGFLAERSANQPSVVA